ncbi:MAG: hypothetical protein RLY20_739 [Verrucomicrobiota bacterium]|jgi:beta-glucosidase
MKQLLLITLAASLLWTHSRAADEITGRFAPPAGKVLVFIGQDNASVGGNSKYHDGYVDNVGVPGGITHYVYFTDGWTNKFGRSFNSGRVAGLNTETEWAAGPMNMKAYVGSPVFSNCVFHLSISLEGNCEDKVADGSLDHFIAEFVEFIKAHPEHPFLIRIGYEFDGSWNAYDPENFKKAFRRIVDALRKEKLPNFATVFASSSTVKPGQFEKYDPGAEYYEWVGYSWWGGDKDALPALAFARKVRKPVIIAEATPRGHFLEKEDADTVWKTWFEKFFAHIEKNKDVVRAVSYINADWESQPMWKGGKWGQTRVETSPEIKKRWLEKMADPMFINAAQEPFKHIGFPAKYEAPKASATASPAKSSAATAPAGAKGDAVPADAPYKNPKLPVEQRVEDLLGRMTLAEKVAQITGWWNPDEKKLRAEGAIFTPGFYAKNCPNGIGALGPLHNLTIEEDARCYAAVQQYFRNQTRLGIPPLLQDEAAHGLMKYEANSFPVPIGLACTWNQELIRRIFIQAANEARSRGVAHVLAPIVDVTRDVRWGRVDETLGEDPFLVGRLGAAMVCGLQGSDDGSIASGHVAATLKHFVGYAGTEGGRNRSPYPNGPRHLLDTEVAPFRHVIGAAKPAAVMAAFNEVDGIPCHVNSWVLTEVLRGQLGFGGLVVGDYQGIDLVRRYQKMAASDADAGRMALAAGLQLELPNNFGFRYLPELLNQGEVQSAQIDAAVRAVLSLKFRLGLFEAASELDVAQAKSLVTSSAATELAREAARQSMVLLKNNGDMLPLNPGNYKRVAVIGPNAGVCRLGGYSGKPLKTVSLYEGIRVFLGGRATVTLAEGCKIASNDTGDSYENWRYVNKIEFATLTDNQPLITEAVALAGNSDLVVLALGENEFLAREAWSPNHIGDRTTLDLTESQQRLAEAVLATGKPVVLVLVGGKPVTLGALEKQFPAILAAHYAGQETGTAAAEILFGQTNPSGKLAMSWPRSVGHLPSHYSQQGSAQVFDYVDSPNSAAYPFGHGLSYTTFEYRNVKLSGPAIRPGESVAVSFDLTNTGKRPGTEVAQVYVSGQEFAVARPALELKGFERVALDPGETRRVTVKMDASELFFHDAAMEFGLPRGKYLVRIGGSSEKLSPPLTLRTGPVGATFAPEPVRQTGQGTRPKASPQKKSNSATARKPAS